MIPINYKGDSTGGMYRPDLVVQGCVIIEIKAVDRLAIRCCSPNNCVVLGVLGGSVSN